MFPLDFEKSDFLLVGYEKISNQFFYSGYQGYVGPQHNRVVNDCLDARIRQAGFEVESPIIISPSMAILKKNSPVEIKLMGKDFLVRSQNY
jgi:hypothetical protein